LQFRLANLFLEIFIRIYKSKTALTKRKTLTWVAIWAWQEILLPHLLLLLLLLVHRHLLLIVLMLALHPQLLMQFVGVSCDGLLEIWLILLGERGRLVLLL